MGVDEETFLGHLKGLNLDTGGVSFGWLLEEDNEILNWFYKNVNSNNCLTNEDKVKFSELEESGEVLEQADLEIELANISKKYEGIALPGEVHGISDVKHKIDNLQEWTSLMETQLAEKGKLLETSSSMSRDLSRQQFELNEELSIASASLARLTADCEELVVKARGEKLQYHTLLEEVLKICTASKHSEEKIFFSQLPLEEYLAKTEQLVTYLQYSVSRQLEYLGSEGEAAQGQDPELVSGDMSRDARLAEVKLKETCEKLKDGLCFYIKTKAELSGVQEQLKFIEEYDVDSFYDPRFEKAKIAGMVKILEVEVDGYQQQKLPLMIQQFVDKQSEQVLLSEMQLRYEKIKYIYDKFCSVVSLSQEAVNGSCVALVCLRRDQLAVDNLLHFSKDTMTCLQAEMAAKKAREMIPHSISDMSFLMKTLYGYFQINEQLPVSELCEIIERLHIEIKNLENSVFYEKIYDIFVSTLESKLVTLPMRELIWDGPTDQPSIRNEALDRTLYEIKRSYAMREEEFKTVTKAYMDFKGLTEKNSVMYNLWKWFLSHPSKIRSIREDYSRREHRPTKPFKS